MRELIRLSFGVAAIVLITIVGTWLTQFITRNSHPFRQYTARNYPLVLIAIMAGVWSGLTKKSPLIALLTIASTASFGIGLQWVVLRVPRMAVLLAAVSGLVVSLGVAYLVLPMLHVSWLAQN